MSQIIYQFSFCIWKLEISKNQRKNILTRTIRIVTELETWWIMMWAFQDEQWREDTDERPADSWFKQ